MNITEAILRELLEEGRQAHLRNEAYECELILDEIIDRLDGRWINHVLAEPS